MRAWDSWYVELLLAGLYAEMEIEDGRTGPVERGRERVGEANFGGQDAPAWVEQLDEYPHGDDD